jgi:hypothetical protein
MYCTSCMSYFKPSIFSNGSVCENCDGFDEDSVYDLEDQQDDIKIELELLCNPTGRTRAYITDDRGED